MDNKKLWVAAVAIVAVIALMVGVWFITRDGIQMGSKAFTVTVVHADGTERVFRYKTDGTKLGTVLEEKGLISSEGADAGMFHTVDGEKADWSVDQSYWAFYVGEDYATTGIYDTAVTDGGVYRLVYTIG